MTCKLCREKGVLCLCGFCKNCIDRYDHKGCADMLDILEREKKDSDRLETHISKKQLEAWEKKT